MKINYVHIYKKVGYFLLALAISLNIVWQKHSDAKAAIPSPLLVTNLNDEGTGSLRYMIDQSNDGDLIVFQDGLSGVINLSRELYIQKSITIAGPGKDLLAINGQAKTNIIRIIRDRTVSISDLSINNGLAARNPGAGISNDGKLSLTNVKVFSNKSNTFAGGIYNAETGEVNMLQVEITQNTALGSGATKGGGGVWNDGIMVINYGIISENQATVFGGGIYNEMTGQLELNFSQIDENIVNNPTTGNSSFGGGLFNQADFTQDPDKKGQVVIRRSSFSGNKANGSWGSGGAISNVGNLSLDTVTISNNLSTGVGGGIDNIGTMEIYQGNIAGNSTNGTSSDGGGIETSGILTIINSAIVNNTATRYGGGIDKWLGRTWIVNSTISGNQSDQYGGGIFNNANQIELTNNTITNNTADADMDGIGTGGGVFNHNEPNPSVKPQSLPPAEITTNSTYMVFQNTILAGNIDKSGNANDCSADQNGYVTSATNNLIQDLNGCPLDGDKTNDIYNTDPKLLLLADNGGRSLTHHPKIGSPVLDSGHADGCQSDDQRTTARPFDGDADGNAICDIGAIEAILGPSGGNWTPFANPDSVYTFEDLPVEINLTGADPEGDPITFSIYTQPKNGTLSGNPPLIIYTPNKDYYGTDSFGFQVTDNQNGSSIATVNLNILGVNDAPEVEAGPDKLTIEGFDIEFEGSYFDVDETSSPYVIWDFGDGTTSEGSLYPSHLFPSAGVYTAILYVIDSEGAVGADYTTVYVQPRAELSLQKISLDDPALSGAPITYSLVVTNQGPSNATGVVVEDNISPDVNYISASEGCTHTTDPETGDEKVSCQIETIPVGSNATVQVIVSTPYNFKGTIGNSASVSGSELDLISSDNSVFITSQVVQTYTAYCNDFQSGSGPEWSNMAVSASPNGHIFLGDFSNETTILNLNDLPVHTQLQFIFDLYVIRSWDGNEIYTDNFGMKAGPDRWKIDIDGQELKVTSFSNMVSQNFKQSYPADYPFGNYLPQTSANAVNSLGYTYNNFPMDSVYQINSLIDHNQEELTLSLSAFGLQPKNDESWGIDNICVEVSYLALLYKNSIFIPLVSK